nr:hypothetical protein [Streptomyces sp. Tu 2975]
MGAEPHHEPPSAPHPDQERGAACVVLAPGATLSEAELIARCEEEMAGYKYPRLAEFFDVLPTNATGKIHKPTPPARSTSASSGRPVRPPAPPSPGDGQHNRWRSAESARGGFIRPAERGPPLR